MSSVGEMLMPKKTAHAVGRSEPAAQSAKKQKKRMKTCQLAEDVVFWAGVISSFEGKAIADVLDDVARRYVRERLRTHTVDPDEAYAKFLAEQPDK